MELNLMVSETTETAYRQAVPRTPDERIAVLSSVSTRTHMRDHVPVTAESQCRLETSDMNDMEGSAQTQANLVHEPQLDQSNALLVVSDAIASNLESGYSCGENKDMAISLRLKGLLSHAEATETLGDQPGSSSELDKTSAPGGLATIIAALRAVRGLVDNNDTDLTSLNLLIQLVSQEEILGDDGNPNLPNKLLFLSQLLLKRAIVLDSAPDMNHAIECLTRVSGLIGEHHTLRVQVLNSLALAHQRRYERYGVASDIEATIEYQRQTITSAGNQHKRFAVFTAELGSMLMRRHQASGGLDDLRKSIECQTWALTSISESGDDRANLLNNLGNAHWSQFERLSDLDDISRAIEYLSQAVDLTAEGHPNKPSRLSNLGGTYMRLFERLGNLEDISRAIECQTRAVQITPYGHPDKPSQLSNLGGTYTRLFERLGNLEDVSRAIGFQTRAVHLTPDGHPDKPTILNNLGSSYLCRFERLGELEDVSRAIDCQTQAVQITPDGHPDRPSRINSLGNSYKCRFERLGELEDVSRAIDCQTQAVQITPDGHPVKPSTLNNLGTSYLCRFQRQGNLEDINKSIECKVQAVLLTPHGHPDMSIQFNNLGNSYLSRFERLGELEDIDSAINYLTQAAQLTSEEHPDRPGQLANLGNSYLCRYERMSGVDDANIAVHLFTRALSLTPDRHPDLPGRLNGLGIAYSHRVKHGVDDHDLDHSVQCAHQAATITSHEHADKPGRLLNLGDGMRMRFQYLRKKEDNESAIETYSRALQLLPQDHVDTPVIQNALARSYRTRLTYSDDLQDTARAISLFAAAARSSTGSPTSRFQASREWAALLSVLDLSPSLPAHRISMQLLYDVVWLGTTSARRYERITEVGAVTIEAAAAAISANEYSLALEWLEQGRSIVWNQALQLRTPVEALMEVRPELGWSLEQVCRNLELANRRVSNPSPIGANTMALEQATLQHHRLVAQYNALIDQARSVPGFEYYMRAKKVVDLIPGIQSGPVVVVNVHTERCDALVLRPQSDNVEHIPLPNLFHKDVVELQRNMQQSLESKSLRDRKPHIRCRGSLDHLEQVLIALWHNLVKPVLDYLGYTTKLPIDELPHITWCTTGALSFLPIHAAGNYDSGKERIYDYAITSYTPTLSALLPSLPSSYDNESGVLIVSQESTHGLPSLPGTKHELTAIQRHLKDTPHRKLENSQATPAAVLAAMEKYECVHLACHGSQDIESPTKSCFHLHGGTLTLEEIAQRSLKNKGLAFLSACQTAMGDEKMPDEAIHLAAGMLVAGYPSVIATMWSIGDADAPVVAEEVYGQLVKDEKLDWSRSARALHTAVGALRKKVGEHEYTRWVPYVHIGA